ncbi:MAG: lipoyl synthase [Spirochaetia bacterium]|nr:lipoyl synthase [Spirochaetia bacterium]MCF7942059.1 lipoyl synthase [Spirochaetia bacterium]
MKETKRLPAWIRKQMYYQESFMHTEKIIAQHGITTICSQAKCPNRGECWTRGTATVLILGEICTRNCPFCAVGHGKPEPPDPTEPERIAQMVLDMDISYLVITSVDRDDLPDGGASHFRDVILACRAANPLMRFELLVPDFKDSQDHSLEILSQALPFVFSHNIETPAQLYATARPGGVYSRSLQLLAKASERWPEVPIKSSIMLGLGESEQQVLQTLKDLHDAGCDRLAMGQYLRPSAESLPVAEFVTPEKFTWWEEQARSIGFDWVMASPFTRSSYHADA